MRQSIQCYILYLLLQETGECDDEVGADDLEADLDRRDLLFVVDGPEAPVAAPAPHEVGDRHMGSKRCFFCLRQQEIRYVRNKQTGKVVPRSNLGQLNGCPEFHCDACSSTWGRKWRAYDAGSLICHKEKNCQMRPSCKAIKGKKRKKKLFKAMQ